MMRLLGVLVGSALAVAALVVFVGIPEFTTETSVSDNTVITLPMRTEPSAPALPGETAEPEPVEVPPSDPDPVESSSLAEADGQTPAEPAIPLDGPAPGPPPSGAETDIQHWYAFWSPFRSEIAATGFVDQLQRVTGLDYRVVKVKPGVYEVAFAYGDDEEITANLSQISAATGLKLPES